MADIKGMIDIEVIKPDGWERGEVNQITGEVLETLVQMKIKETTLLRTFS